MAVERENDRCAWCGWPLANLLNNGCVRGNCSMRPLPTVLYDHERAFAEATSDTTREYIRTRYPEIVKTAVTETVVENDLLQGCAVIRCSHCGCPSVQEPGHDYCQTCARSVGLQGAPAARFIDAWSRWALNGYVCTDTPTRINLRVLREQLCLEEVDGAESWEVDKLYEKMVACRDALHDE